MFVIYVLGAMASVTAIAAAVVKALSAYKSHILGSDARDTLINKTAVILADLVVSVRELRKRVESVEAIVGSSPPELS
jgi:hypothetical protein